MTWTFDYLIVGAGFAGLTMAERLTTQRGKTCLVVDKRPHIGGNAADRYDDHGVLIHPYGPHYFRTNSPKIVAYLSHFTDWRPVEYEVLSYTDDRYWRFPINLNTFEQLIGRSATSAEMERWLAKHRVAIAAPQNSEDVILSQVGPLLYEKFFKGYTLKQWRRHPRELDASVCGRIPIRTNRDNRYLRETFQALPSAGYTRLFERMVAACGPRLRLLLNTDYRAVVPHVSFSHMIFTGPIDELYDYRFGALPYRSLRFEHESFTKEQLLAREPIAGKPGFWQPAMQVNYPNSEAFTRIVEVKHATGQACDNTTIVREYPDDYGPGKEPFYPVPAPEAAVRFRQYDGLVTGGVVPACLEAAARHRGAVPTVSLVGRLATYRYYNMDQVVGMALAEFERLDGTKRVTGADRDSAMMAQAA
jgi:UDP-galactopyranose mutase